MKNIDDLIGFLEHLKGLSRTQIEIESVLVNLNEIKEQLTLPVVVDSEAELCGKNNCNRPKLDGNVYCSYHYSINFG